MKIIALTSANEAAMAAVAEHVLAAAQAQGLQLTVSVGIQDAHAAQAVYREGGELWRIGEDDSRPELDALVDRVISDAGPFKMREDVEKALSRFLGKTRVAA